MTSDTSLAGAASLAVAEFDACWAVTGWMPATIKARAASSGKGFIFRPH
jgi:hypothetical protein